MSASVLQFFRRIFSSELLLKVILFFIILATVPVLVLGGMTLYLLDLTHRRDVSALELQLIAQKNQEIEKFFTDTLGILELRVGFTQRSDISINDQLFILQGLLNENPAFREVRFMNLSGLETARLSRVGRTTEKLQDFSRLPEFTTAASGTAYKGSVYRTLEGHFITLSAPVRNKNDEIIQVLAADVSLDTLVRSVESAALGSSGYLVLLDKSGALITRGGGNAPVYGRNFSTWSRVRTISTGASRTGLGDHDRYESPISGLAVVGAGASVSGLGWALLAEWPLDDADALIRDVRQQILTFTLVSILAVFLLAPLSANRLVQPIRTLERAAAAVEAGGFDTVVAITTRDELEQLGGAFNRMTKGLKRLQELKDEFVFVAAHELRAPVTAIKGYVSMILDGTAGPVNEKVKKFLVPVQQSNDNLVQLVNDLLEIARSEAGRIELEMSAVNLAEIVEEIVTTLQSLAMQKNIALTYEKSTAGFMVLADPKRVREVLTNLISNAIKYNNDGGKVTVSHENTTEGVVTHVADNGFGIPADAQAHMFEKFYRVKTEKTRTVQGTGLGLFIIKQLVEKMNGKIWFTSKEGEGTTFSFRLPNVA